MSEVRKNDEKKIMKYFKAAKRLYHKDGEVEVDIPERLEAMYAEESRLISESEGGAYVRAWVWVAKEGAESETYNFL